ncbi:hypothetical protein ZWY2020_040688 [Hordeum vulgare]|nr:hypothetical protein ZWY2020_040688 [Hordeum vulgare]
MPSDAAAKGVKLERYASAAARCCCAGWPAVKFVSPASRRTCSSAPPCSPPSPSASSLFALHYPSLLSCPSSPPPPPPSPSRSHRSLLAYNRRPRRPRTARRALAEGDTPERQAAPGRGLSVLVTGAGGFVGAHCSLALKARGDGVVGPRQLLTPTTTQAQACARVLHLAAQKAGVRYAMEAPQTYVASNVAGLVSVFEAAAKPRRPAAGHRLGIPHPPSTGSTPTRLFSEDHRTDRPASLYAATKKAGEAIAQWAYNHIYGLSITGLRFFTVYGPWGPLTWPTSSFARSIVAK